jgi:hypothetical protein
LSDLKEVKPDVCITAAYGNILPQRFLDIPPCGMSSTCCAFTSSVLLLPYTTMQNDRFIFKQK